MVIDKYHILIHTDRSVIHFSDTDTSDIFVVIDRADQHLRRSFRISFRIGIILGVISSLLFALYAVFNERVNVSSGVIRTTALQMIGGSIGISLLFPIYWLNMPAAVLLPTTEDMGFLLLLALGCTVCMCSLLNRAQKTISAFTVSLSFNLEPVYSIILAIIIFDEDKMLGIAFYIGLSMIILSLLLQLFHVAYEKHKASIKAEIS